MSKNKELLVKGNVSQNELSELNDLFGKEASVSEISLKTGGVEEVLQIVFRDFDVITFTRDFILGAAVNQTIDKLKKAVKYFRKKNKKVASVSIEIDSTYKEKKFIISLVAAPSDINYLVKKSDDKLTLDLINKIENKSTIHISFDGNDDVEITILHPNNNLAG